MKKLETLVESGIQNKDQSGLSWQWTHQNTTVTFMISHILKKLVIMSIQWNTTNIWRVMWRNSIYFLWWNSTVRLLTLRRWKIMMVKLVIEWLGNKTVIKSKKFFTMLLLLLAFSQGLISQKFKVLKNSKEKSLIATTSELAKNMLEKK